jgi:hypothetical protein
MNGQECDGSNSRQAPPLVVYLPEFKMNMTCGIANHGTDNLVENKTVKLHLRDGLACPPLLTWMLTGTVTWACRHATVVRYLLELGADPLLTDSPQGRMALHYAASSTWVTCMEVLLSDDTTWMTAEGEQKLRDVWVGDRTQGYHRCACGRDCKGCRLPTR